jgi:hypothetical protein
MAGIGMFQHTDLLSILKWKQRERTAVRTAPSGQSRLHVVFDMPPAGDYDLEKKRPLTPIEHIKLFGKRLLDAWGSRIAFIDARCLDDDRHKEGFTNHPLTELLQRAKVVGATACPTLSLNHSQEYRRAVRRFVQWNPELPVCVRVEAADLDSQAFSTELAAMMRDVECKPSNCFLVLDFRSLEMPSGLAISDFVELLADRIADLPFLHEWSGFATAFTSFPTTIKLKPGDVKEYPRLDFALYSNLISNPKGLLRTPMYGDYALDPSPPQKPQQRIPSAHLRYSTPKDYVISKGTSVKKPNGYEAIFPVADALVATSHFAGAAYSKGDAYISGLQQRTSSKGNASTWRWASTDHHITRNIDLVSELYGLSKATALRPEDAPALQGDFFTELESAPTDTPDDGSEKPTEP